MFAVRWNLSVSLGLMAVVLTGCLGTPVKVEVVEKKEPVKIDIGEDLAPIKLDRVVVNLRRGTTIGSYIYQPFVCMALPGNIHWSAGRTAFKDLEFQDVFFQEMSAANFKVIGDPDEMFADAARDAVVPEFLIGAQLEDIRLNICEQMDFFTGWRTDRQSGEASVRVTWQVFSNFERKVVYSGESEGSAKLDAAVPDGTIVLVRDAFGDAVANLRADEKFVALLRQQPQTMADVRRLEADELVLPELPLFDDPIADKIDMIRQAVVTIEVGDGHGSGFFVAPNLILTNHHVVGTADLLRIKLQTGRKILGEVVRKHPERDVALIQVEAAGHRPLPIRFDPVKITEEVYAIGAPLSKAASGTVTKGIVSRFTTNRYGLEDIQADVDVHGGNSGGALLDAQGNVVGVTYAGLIVDETQHSIGMNLFIPIYDALEKLNISVDKTRGRIATN